MRRETTPNFSHDGRAARISCCYSMQTRPSSKQARQIKGARLLQLAFSNLLRVCAVNSKKQQEGWCRSRILALSNSSPLPHGVPSAQIEARIEQAQPKDRPPPNYPRSSIEDPAIARFALVWVLAGPIASIKRKRARPRLPYCPQQNSSSVVSASMSSSSKLRCKQATRPGRVLLCLLAGVCSVGSICAN